jgi:hypothetical protein
MKRLSRPYACQDPVRSSESEWKAHASDGDLSGLIGHSGAPSWHPRFGIADGNVLVRENPTTQADSRRKLKDHAVGRDAVEIIVHGNHARSRQNDIDEAPVERICLPPDESFLF